jgi:hypothetical protein
MKLIRAHVKNFQSVHDSTPFEIHDVTCLVGKNESGKTAILQALYRLNPIDQNEGKYDVTDDYPRTNVTAYEQQVAAGTRNPETVVEATFQLDPAEAARLEGDLGEGVLLDRSVTLVKGYENALRYRLTASEPIAGKALLSKSKLVDHLQTQGATWNSLEELGKLLDKRAEAAQQAFTEQTALANAKADPTEKVAALAEASKLQEGEEAKTARKKIQAIAKQGLRSHIYSVYLEPNIPKFLYFDEYYQMRGCENIEALQTRVNSGALNRSDHPLLGLIDLAALKLPELLNPSRTRDLINKLEGAGNHLSKQILKYWSQNKHLQLKFDVRPARPGDPEDMRQGNNIWSLCL